MTGGGMKNKEIRVLMIDDDVSEHFIVETEMARARRRFILDFASTYEEGLALIKKDLHDAYLVDYNLGERNGVELIKACIADGSKKPHIILTGHDDDSLDELAMKSGAADYLPKKELSATLMERIICHAIERNKMLLRVEYMATHDSLTGLANRSLFIDCLKRACSRARRHHHQIAVLYLDLDKFKKVNDTLGHHHGDLLLKAFASRLGENLRKEDVVGRMGGDEFTVLIEDISSKSQVLSVAEKTIAAVTQPYTLEKEVVRVGTSIGAALYPEDGDYPEDLIKNSDKALYRAKEEGGNRVIFFK